MLPSYAMWHSCTYTTVWASAAFVPYRMLLIRSFAVRSKDTANPTRHSQSPAAFLLYRMLFMRSFAMRGRHAQSPTRMAAVHGSPHARCHAVPLAAVPVWF